MKVIELQETPYGRKVYKVFHELSFKKLSNIIQEAQNSGLFILNSQEIAELERTIRLCGDGQVIGLYIPKIVNQNTVNLVLDFTTHQSGVTAMFTKSSLENSQFDVGWYFSQEFRMNYKDQDDSTILILKTIKLRLKTLLE